MHVDMVPLTGMINKIIGLKSLQFYQERNMITIRENGIRGNNSVFSVREINLQSIKDKT